MEEVEKCGEGVVKCRGRCEKRCWAVWGRCGEVCWGAGEVRGDVGSKKFSSHFPHTFLLISFTSPHFSPHSNAFPYISFHTFPLLPYSPHTWPTPKLPKIPQFPHHPYSSKLPQFFITSYFPHIPLPVLPIVTLSFTPHQNFSFFSVITKLIQQSNALETPRKFHKKKIKNKNKKWQHNIQALIFVSDSDWTQRVVSHGSTVNSMHTLCDRRKQNKNKKWQHDIYQTTWPLTNQALNIQNCTIFFIIYFTFAFLKKKKMGLNRIHKRFD